MQAVLDYFITNIFQNTPVLMALIVVLGLVLMKKRWDDVLKGAFLAAIGMTIINLAVDILLLAVVPEAALTGIAADGGGQDKACALWTAPGHMSRRAQEKVVHQSVE